MRTRAKFVTPAMVAVAALALGACGGKTQAVRNTATGSGSTLAPTATAPAADATDTVPADTTPTEPPLSVPAPAVDPLSSGGGSGSGGGFGAGGGSGSSGGSGSGGGTSNGGSGSGSGGNQSTGGGNTGGGSTGGGSTGGNGGGGNTPPTIDPTAPRVISVDAPTSLTCKDLNDSVTFTLHYQVANALFIQWVSPGGNPDAPGTGNADGSMDMGFTCNRGASQVYKFWAVDGMNRKAEHDFTIKRVLAPAAAAPTS